MKKLIIAALALVTFASCSNIYNETHTFVHREKIAGVMVTETRVITSADLYHPTQLVMIDGKIWECQN